MENTYQKECGVEGLASESGTDYTLPDYQGEVKKLLSTKARLIPSGRFVDGAAAQFAGVIAYDVLYADEEGKLTCAAFTSDYDFSVPVPENGSARIGADTQISGLSVRLSGARRISARTMLTSRVNVGIQQQVDVAGDLLAETQDSPETLTCSLQTRFRLFADPKEREFAEEAAQLEGVDPEDVRIIASGGSVRIESAEVAQDELIVRGQTVLHAILSVENQAPYVVRKSIPFEETIPLEQAHAGMRATADGYCTSVSTAARSDGAGGTIVTLNAIAEMVGEAEENRPLSVVTDAYSTVYDTENDYGSLQYEESLDAVHAVFRIEGESENECDGAPMRDAVDTFAQCRLTEISPDAEGVVLRGECTFTVVGNTLREDGSAGFCNRKFTVPFEHVIATQIRIPQGAQIEYRMRCEDADATVDGEKIYASAYCLCSVWMYQRRSAPKLDAAHRTDAHTPVMDAGVTVYYPDREDTLWSVAKRYRVSVRALAEDNALSTTTAADSVQQQSLAGVDSLLIFPPR